MATGADKNGIDVQVKQPEDLPANAIGLRRRVKDPQPMSPYTPMYDFSALGDAHPTTVAFEYLDNGFWLLPVDNLTAKAVSVDGYCKATNDFLKIQEWLQMPNIAVGIATGRRSGIVAFRCKGDLGRRTFNTLLADKERFTTLMAGEGNDTIYLFRAPKESCHSREEIALGVDFLAEDGIFVPSPLSWSPQKTELAVLPDWLRSLSNETTTTTLANLVATGDFAALNHVSPHEAAKAYDALGWKLVPLHEDGDRVSDPGTISPPEKWNAKPTIGLGVKTGVASGVVGVWIGDFRKRSSWEAKYGPLPLPRIEGNITILFFRAPIERFPSREIFDNVMYIGEDYFLPVPPSKRYRVALQWAEAKFLSPGLPELPEWLQTLLSKQLDSAPIPLPQKTTQAPKAENPEKAPRHETEALNLAARGWLVFPVKPGGKTPLTKNGLKDATRDRKKIAQWWRRNPKANIGVQTGSESGIVVLDVDVKNGQKGLQSLAALEERHGCLATLRAHTPTGGLHLFFRSPTQVVRNRAGFLPGLDVRGQGGYVVAAPSRVGGVPYRWENPSAEIAVLPDWLLALMTAKPKKGKVTSPAQQERASFSEALRGVQEGSRNDTIFRLACRLRQDGWEFKEALVLVRTAAGNCQPPLPDEETIRCLESAWRYAPPEALTDIGNAERLVSRFGDLLRYVAEKDRWLVWAGHYWEKNLRAVYLMAKTTVRSLRDEAAAETDPARRRLLFAHGRKSENRESIERMLEIAGLELAVRPEDLDRDGLAAFSNGVLELDGRTFRPGRREDLLTKHAPFPYDPENPACAQWLQSPSSLKAKNPALSDIKKQWQEKLDQWLTERCQLGQKFSSQAMVLHEDFSTWLGKEVTRRRFGDLMSQKGFRRRKSSIYLYDGLRLRDQL